MVGKRLIREFPCQQMMADGLGVQVSSDQLMMTGEQVMMAAGLLVRRSAGQVMMTGELQVQGPYPVMMLGEIKALGSAAQVMLTAELQVRGSPGWQGMVTGWLWR